jgi:hypothetical protein
MFDEFTDGACPQCRLNGESVQVRINSSDLLECPQCKLQALVGAGGLILLRSRGKGNFKPGARQPEISGSYLCAEDEPGTVITGADNPVSITSEESLRRWLAGDRITADRPSKVTADDVLDGLKEETRKVFGDFVRELYK